MNNLIEKIDGLIQELQKGIAEAAKKADFSLAARLSEKAREVELTRQELRGIDSRLEQLRNDLSVKDTQKISDAEFRVFFCKVTGGCIRQNLLILTHQIRMGFIRIGEEMEIEMHDGKKFVTDVVEKGNKLRERGEIARFYRENHVNEGDYVVLEEVSLGKWLLRKTRPTDNSPKRIGY